VSQAAQTAETPTDGPRIVILGAGMSGLCMGIRLKQAGITSFTILEKAGGIGGTWWDNTYPGAQCDVRSHLYSYSFELYPDWTRTYAPQAEIQSYMEHCTRKYRLLPHIRFNTEIAAAHFDAGLGLWLLRTGEGEELSANIFICSSAPLNQPRYPDIPGLGRFRGSLFHSSRWDHDYDFAGKRVAVIGNAASAVQLIPQIAPLVQRLSIFQRSPNWIVPRPDRAYATWEKALFRIPLIGHAHRYLLYWLHEMNRLALNQGSVIAKLATRTAEKHLRSQIADEELRAALRPDYPLGCKRILLSNDYYPTLLRPNVELVTLPIERVTANAIATSDGQERPLDAIICATGFEAVRMLSSVHIEGLSSNTLAAAWKQGPEAYHGVSVAGFPNLFLLLGPNTGQGHTSTLLYIEAQVDYTIRCIRELLIRRRSYLAVKSEVMERHNRELQAQLKNSVWASGCGSWYKTKEGKISAIHPGYSFQYIRQMREPRFEDYAFH
jgi:cation diffusion facilitator CzcD-associated flavoprotein CzcO